MKIVHLATSLYGGAGIAARRIVAAQVENGMDSVLISANGKSEDLNKNEKLLDRGSFKKLKSKALTFAQTNLIQRADLLVTPFSVSNMSQISPHLKSADIIHVHAFYNLLRTSELMRLSSSKKIFVTLHDERFFTGGCHYSMGCENFGVDCKKCPQVNQLSQIFPKMALRSSLAGLKTSENLQFIVPSEWLATQARSSALLRFSKTYTVSNPVPSTFHISGSDGLQVSDTNSLTIGFISENLNNPYKGIEVLRQALAIVGDRRNIRVNLFGSGNPGLFSSNVLLTKSRFSSTSEAQKAIASCDFVVVPSTQDNSPSVISESLMCGVPVLGSRTGGITEILQEFDQPLFESANAFDLAEKIMHYIPSRLNQALMQRIQKKYSYKSSAEVHKLLYEKE